MEVLPTCPFPTTITCGHGVASVLQAWKPISCLEGDVYVLLEHGSKRVLTRQQEPR